ncbi:unnamed protein product [Tilletia caries]|nr:unnamed protein product [Tilletia caries]
MATPPSFFFPPPPLDATAGFTPSQAITVGGTQSQGDELPPSPALPPTTPTGATHLTPDDDLAEYEDPTYHGNPASALPPPAPSGSTPATLEDDLVDYDETMHPSNPTTKGTLSSSPAPTQHSDSTTSSSHLPGGSQDILMDEDQDFIAPDTQPVVLNSQLTDEAATLSQEVAGLGPPSSTPLDRYLNRPAEGAYAEVDDDADYTDSDQDDATSSSSAEPEAIPPPAPVAQIPLPSANGLEAISFYRSRRGRQPLCDPFTIRAAAGAYGGIPPGACRYLLPTWWKHNNDAHLQWAEDAFEEALTQRFATFRMPREFTTFFHTQGSEARQKAVDVYTAHTELHLALVDSSLVLPGSDSFSHAVLSPPKAGLAISPRYIPCRVRFDAKTTSDEAKVALLHTFSNVHTAYVVEAWELTQHDSTSTPPVTSHTAPGAHPSGSANNSSAFSYASFVQGTPGPQSTPTNSSSSVEPPAPVQSAPHSSTPTANTRPSGSKPRGSKRPSSAGITTSPSVSRVTPSSATSSSSMGTHPPITTPRSPAKKIPKGKKKATDGLIQTSLTFARSANSATFSFTSSTIASSSAATLEPTTPTTTSTTAPSTPSSAASKRSRIIR